MATPVVGPRRGVGRSGPSRLRPRRPGHAYGGGRRCGHGAAARRVAVRPVRAPLRAHHARLRAGRHLLVGVRPVGSNPVCPRLRCVGRSRWAGSCVRPAHDRRARPHRRDCAPGRSTTGCDPHRRPSRGGRRDHHALPDRGRACPRCAPSPGDLGSERRLRAVQPDHRAQQSRGGSRVRPDPARGGVGVRHRLAHARCGAARSVCSVPPG